VIFFKVVWRYFVHDSGRNAIGGCVTGPQQKSPLRGFFRIR
jgi:hypothetical protein